MTPHSLSIAMKTIPLSLAATLLAVSAFAAPVIIPEPLPIGRYEKMMDDSPFVLATAEAKPEAKEE